MAAKYTVAVVKTRKAVYPQASPYHPSTAYPEYPFKKFTSSEINFAYEGVRNVLHQLKLDNRHFNKKTWNPLGKLIKPGMNVVIKPNSVLSRNATGGNIYSTITQPAVIRAIIDYCFIALKGKGSITIADAPQYNCDFSELKKVTQLEKVITFLNDQHGPKAALHDLRTYWAAGRHFPSNRRELPGDPQGTTTINLGKKGMLASHSHPDKLYGAVYHRQETIHHHHGTKQEYELSKTILNSDVLINVPKLKVHKKVGVTLNYKNLVGANVNKNLIVHYTLGLPNSGGAHFPEGLLTTKQYLF